MTGSSDPDAAGAASFHRAMRQAHAYIIFLTITAGVSVITATIELAVIVELVRDRADLIALIQASAGAAP